MSNIQRSYIVGGEWLYYKIYTGPKTADLVLTEIMKPITENLLSQGVIDKWFFIRYSDPKHHIRVRFHYTAPENVAQIINTLYPLLLDFVNEDLIWKIQLDTYQREIERYGESTMELSETLFYYESNMIMNFLDMIDGDQGEELRWLFSVKAIDQLLSDFGYNEDAKLNLLERIKTAFGIEFGMNKGLKKQLDKKYREEQDKIRSFLGTEVSSEYAPIFETIDQKSKDCRDTIKKIVMVRKEEELHDMMSSYIHMLMNRLFRSRNRLHEMVIYDLLYKHYKKAWGIRMFANK